MAVLLAFTTFFVVVGILMIPLVFAAGGRHQQMMRRRLESIEKARARNESSLELELLRSELLSAVPPLHRLLMRWNWSVRLREFIAQAGMNVKPGVLLLASGILGLVGYLIGLHLFLHQLLAIPFAVAGLVIPSRGVGF